MKNCSACYPTKAAEAILAAASLAITSLLLMAWIGVEVTAHDAVYRRTATDAQKEAKPRARFQHSSS